MNESPAPNINPNNFSIVCEGLLKPPVSDTYKFHCEADDGCIIEINNTVILNDNMPENSNKDFLADKRKQFLAALSGGN